MCMLYPSPAVAYSHSHYLSTMSFSGWWRRSIWHGRSIMARSKLDIPPMRFVVQHYSTKPKTTRKSRRLLKSNVAPLVAEEEDESKAFFVVRKGDIIGIYKSLSDCQSQVSSSVSDPSVSVYKGYSLSKYAEDYLVSRGLKSSIYTINALDIKEDLFGTLLPCPFRQPDGPVSSPSKTSKRTSPQLASQEEEAVQSMKDCARRHDLLADVEELKPSSCISCVLEFDGASKGNPGRAGAGAILRTRDGRMVWRLRQGLGSVTCNVAEYRALILGMKYALEKGFKEICAKGDSKLICFQVQNAWRVKSKNLVDLCKEAKEIKDKFLSFEISHVARERNSEADAQANLAVSLADGQISVDCVG